MRWGGQRSYDDDISGLAAASINAELVEYDKELKDVVREQLWDVPADVSE